jgi:CubicO group peptidase (beta-lactamase class C family)
MHRFQLAIVLLAMWARTAAAEQQVVPGEGFGLSPERLTRLSAFLEQQVARGALPGAVVAIARNGRVAYFESFGSIQRGAGPMPKDALFQLSSMTKPWVAVAAMILVEEGRIQLTDPVSKWFPAFRNMSVAASASTPSSALALVPAKREITIYDLLRHTSGLIYPNFVPPGSLREQYEKAGIAKLGDRRKLTLSELLDRYAKMPLSHEPGTAWEYGVGYDVLGAIIEATTGERLGQFLADRLFRPLGMHDSGFRIARQDLRRTARADPVDPKTGKPNDGYVDLSSEPRFDSGGDGGVSSAGDYLRFVQMLAQDGELDGVRILSPASVRLMTTNQLGPEVDGAGLLPLGSPGYGWGLGFAVRKAGSPANMLGSPGELLWGGRVGSLFWADPSHQLVGVFMAQTSASDFGYYRRVVKEIVDAAIVDDRSTHAAPPRRTTTQK